MPYLNLKQLIKKVGQSESTVNRKLKHLKEHNLAIYTKHTKRDKAKNNQILYDTKLVAYMKKASNFKNYKSQQKPHNQDNTPNMDGLEEETVRRVATLLNGPVLTQLTDSQQKIFKALRSQDDKDRFQISVHIAHQYATTELNIAECCDKAGIAVRTFNQWCSTYAYIAEVYKGAKKHHKRLVRKAIAEEAETGLLKLVRGGKKNKVKIKQVLTKDGEIKELTERSAEDKDPHFNAVAFALTNLRGKRYKNKQVIETDEVSPEQEADDLIAQMSEAEKAEALHEFMTANVKKLDKAVEKDLKEKQKNPEKKKPPKKK